MLDPGSQSDAQRVILLLAGWAGFYACGMGTLLL